MSIKISDRAGHDILITVTPPYPHFRVTAIVTTDQYVVFHVMEQDSGDSEPIEHPWPAQFVSKPGIGELRDSLLDLTAVVKYTTWDNKHGGEESDGPVQTNPDNGGGGQD
jgi:hypothetical protein